MPLVDISLVKETPVVGTTALQGLKVSEDRTHCQCLCSTRIVSVHSLDRDVSRFFDAFGKGEENTWLANQYANQYDLTLNQNNQPILTKEVRDMYL